ncbi:MAG: hypothetical protein AAGJ18_10770 [Bacteroidota bacterium]
MEPTDVHFQIQAFIELAKKSGQNDVAIEKCQTNMFDKFLTEPAFQQKFGQLIQKEIEKIKTTSGITISADQIIPCYLFSPQLRWSRVDKEHGQPALSGGFCFNQGVAMVTEKLDGWKSRYADFLAYEAGTPEDQVLLDQLVWFESLSLPLSGLLTPFLGCVLPNSRSFPHDFYFFDDGLIYRLPFGSYRAYIEALLANAAIKCWQYFYIPPKELVQKNRGLNYMTTQLRVSTQLAEDIPFDKHDPAFTFDRLDIIHEYLERVVRFLPMAFPTLNFDHQKRYLETLEALI